MHMLKPTRLREGDTIGIIAPCWALKREDGEEAATSLSNMGFHVQFGKHAFSASYGYAGSPRERGEDFNQMLADDKVRLVLFSGGEVGNEILPLIDYQAAAAHPKILLSYSDGTTPLNAVASRAGLCTFYGQAPGEFQKPTEYGCAHFRQALMEAKPYEFQKSGPWETVRGGKGRGRLIGGYLHNLALMLYSPYFSWSRDEKYLLFVEEHQSFFQPAAVSRYLSHIEQSGFFQNVSGLIMGHYSQPYNAAVTPILNRLAKRYGIPVVRTDDFGHGDRHAIIPIGVCGELDGFAQSLSILEAPVQA